LISKEIKSFNLSDLWDDVFSEGMNTLYQCIIRYNENGPKFYTYFLKSLHNSLISYKRKLKRDQHYVFDGGYLKEPICEDYHNLSYRLFEGLTEMEKLVINLASIEGVPVKKIADDFGISTYQVYKILNTAKNKIRKNI
jgi:DNA-directed RNA polymerase specialized sigma24 family protein